MKKKLFLGLVVLFLAFYLKPQSSNWIWAKNCGSIKDDDGYSISTDVLGNIYVVGNFKGPYTTIGSYNLINTDNTGNSSDVFIAKYDANGNVLWAKKVGGPSNDDGKSICTDINGNVYVTGNYIGSHITIESTTLTNSNSSTRDIFIAKFDSNGNLLWAKNEGASGDDYSQSISSDSNGNVFITGYFFSTFISFGSVFLFNTDNTGNTSDIFITKYDANGNVLWSKKANGTYYDVSKSIRVDNNGNAYITGFFRSGQIAFGPINLINSHGTDSDVFLVKYDSNGNVLWANSAGYSSGPCCSFNDEGTGVAVDALGNVYISGRFGSPGINFGSITLYSPGVFIAKYDPNGNVLWAKRGGKPSGASIGGGYATGISVDNNNNVYVTGYYSEYFEFGSISINYASSIDVYVFKCDANGNDLWAKVSGGSDTDYGFGITNDNYGNVYLTGSFKSPNMSFGNIYLSNTTSGYYDVFVAKINDVTSINNSENDDELIVNNYPNPLNEFTVFEYKVLHGGYVKLDILDLMGRKITTLVDQKLSKGVYKTYFETGDLKSGIYLYQLSIDGKVISTKKMIIVK